MKRRITALAASAGLAFVCLALPATAHAAVADSSKAMAPTTQQVVGTKSAEIVSAHKYEHYRHRVWKAHRITMGAEVVLKAIKITHRRERAARAAAAQVAAQAQTQQTPAAVPAVSYSGGGIWSCIAHYESGGDWSINTGNGYYGGLQFTEGSWLGYGGGSYAQYANEATPSQQIAVATKLQAAQGWGAWPVSSVKCGV